MSSETTSRSSAAETDRTAPLDLSRRAYLSEMMDAPCSYEDLRDCLHDLEQVNHVTFAYRPVIGWLDTVARSGQKGPSLHIVDVGCGGGDTLRCIEQWAYRKRLAVRLTGIDLNPNAIRAAREFTPTESHIRWITGDAFSLNTEDDPIDLVISSLFTHHLEDDELVAFLAWMEQAARRGWLINDLHRSRTPYVAFQALAAVARWHPFVRHDGPVSIRRAFCMEDWNGYLAASGIPRRDVHIRSRWPGRLCVSFIRRAP